MLVILLQKCIKKSDTKGVLYQKSVSLCIKKVYHLIHNEINGLQGVVSFLYQYYV